MLTVLIAGGSSHENQTLMTISLSAPFAGPRQRGRHHPHQPVRVSALRGAAHFAMQQPAPLGPGADSTNNRPLSELAGRIQQMTWEDLMPPQLDWSYALWEYDRAIRVMVRFPSTLWRSRFCHFDDREIVTAASLALVSKELSHRGAILTHVAARELCVDKSGIPRESTADTHTATAAVNEYIRDALATRWGGCVVCDSKADCWWCLSHGRTAHLFWPRSVGVPRTAVLHLGRRVEVKLIRSNPCELPALCGG
jgi:hypothetical protein